MRVLSRHQAEAWLGNLGVDRGTMSWRDAAAGFRAIVRESEESTVETGVHRPLELPAESTVVKRALGDRPAMSTLVGAIMEQLDAGQVCAVAPAGAYWLNNRGYGCHLSDVPDAMRLHRGLRSVGLTNRFRGGFLIGFHEFATRIPQLASQPFCGGPDVYFTAARVPLIVMACHEFDLHVSTRHDAVLSLITRLAEERGLLVRGPLAGGTSL